MFTIDQTPEFTHTVKVKVPIDGGHREESFKARFRVLQEDEVDAVDFSDPGSIRAYLRQLVVSMDDLADANGKPLPYSDEVRDQMLRLPYVRIALMTTYRNAMAGERAGN